MSKKHNRQPEMNGIEGAETQEEQSTMDNEQHTEQETQMDNEQSTEHVEGAETEQEQAAENNEQSTAPVVQVTMGIGQFCRHMMLKSSKSNTEILELVLKVYPEAKTTMACIAWYKSDLRKKGLLLDGAAKRSTKQVAFTEEQLKAMAE